MKNSVRHEERLANLGAEIELTSEELNSIAGGEIIESTKDPDPVPLVVRVLVSVFSSLR